MKKSLLLILVLISGLAMSWRVAPPKVDIPLSGSTTTYYLLVNGGNFTVPANTGYTSTSTGDCNTDTNSYQTENDWSFASVPNIYFSCCPTVAATAGTYYGIDSWLVKPVTVGTWSLNATATDYYWNYPCDGSSTPAGLNVSHTNTLAVVNDISWNSIPTLCPGQTISLPSYLNNYNLGYVSFSGSGVSGQNFSAGAGSYTVTAKATFSNTTTTKNITINVYTGTAVGAANSVSLCASGNAVFTASYSGSNTSLQWLESTNSGGSWSNLSNSGAYSGVNTGTLTISGANTSYNGRWYRLYVSGPCDNNYSGVGVLTVYGQVGVSSSFAASGNYCPSGTVSLTASGTPRNGSINYRWQYSWDNATWNDWADAGNSPGSGAVSGTGTSNIVVSLTGSGWNNLYLRCRVYDACGTSTQNVTSSHKIQIYGSVPITVSPTSQTICPNSNTSFTGNGVAQNGSLNFQWRVSTDGGSTFNNVSNGGVYSGATSGTLTLTGAPASYNGYRYHAWISDACGVNSITGDALLTIYNPVTINTQPAAATNVCPGSGNTALFSAAGTGTNGGVSYQWQWSADNSTWNNASDGNNTINSIGGGYSVTGSATSNLSIATPVAGLNSYYFRCVIKDACGTVNQAITTSSKLTVYAPVSISTQPASKQICINSSTSFGVGATISNGTGAYVWQVSTNGGSTWSTVANGGVYSGATTSTLTITSAPITMASYQYRVTVSDFCGVNTQITSSVATLTFFNPAVINTNPVSTSICPSGNTSYSVSATGSNGTLSYAWQVSTDGGTTYSSVANGGIYTGATSNTLTLTGATSAYTGYKYRVNVMDACGAVSQVTSNPATLTIFTPPVIATQPVNTGYCLNSNATFTVGATASTGALSYQWQVSTNGGTTWTNITDLGVYTGSATATLKLTAIDATYSGYKYRVILVDGCGASNQNTSNVVTLTKFAGVTVTTQPGNNSICPNLNTSFTTAATAGNGSLGYAWQVSTNGGTTWTALANGGIYSGVATSTLTLTSVGSSYNSYKYRAVITDACGAVGQATTNAGTLTIYSSPTITAQPANVSYCVGGGAGITVAATAGNGTLTYQWQLSTDNGGTWSNISNAGAYSGTTTSSLSLTGLTAGYSGYKYRVVLTDACGAANQTISNAATVTPFANVSIGTQPANSTICPNASTSFTVAATTSNGSASYAWQVSTNGGTTWTALTNTGIYSGTTTATLSLTTVSLSYSSYKYRVIVSDGCGAVTQATSNAATLTVSNTVAINTQPSNQSTCVGTNGVFTVVGSGTGLSYQWQESSDSGASWSTLSDVGLYSGSATGTLTLASLPYSYNGRLYRAKVTGTCSSTISNSASLTVVLAPSITADPTAATTCAGTAAAFTVTAAGSSPAYQWQYSSTGTTGTYSDITGATSSGFSISNPQAGDAGYYRAKVYNSCGSNFSSGVSLNVNPITAITTQPGNTAVCPGGTASISVTAVGTGTLSYQWQKDSGGGPADITGATSSTLVINNAAASDAAQYLVKVNSSCGSQVVSSSVSLTVNPTPSVPTIVDVSRCGDGPLSATATSSAPNPTFNWYANSADVVPIYNGATYNVGNLTVTTTYYVTAVSLTCESAKQAVNFNHNTPTPVAIGADLSLCVAQGVYDLTKDISSPSAGGGQFTWQANGTNYNSNSFNPNVGQGTYVVTYTPVASVTTPPFCYTPATRNVSVLSNNGDGGITFSGAIVNGGNTINTCVGNDPIVISTLPSVLGGTWSVVQGSGITNNATSTVFTPDQNTYTAINPNIFRYTVNVNGCSSTKDLSVYVKDNQSAPVVTGLPTVVCPGVKLTLAASVSAAGTYTYQWFKAGQTTPFATTSSVDYTVSGSETMNVRSVNSPFGCLSSATAVNITTPFAAGQIGISSASLNVGDEEKFSYSVTNQTNTYQWDFGDGWTSTEQNPPHYYYKSGTYNITLIVISTLGCSQTLNYNGLTVKGTDVNIVLGDPNGSKKADDVEVSVYPIPTDGLITVSSTVEITGYQIFDALGKVKQNVQMQDATKNLDINIADETAGIYILQVTDGKTVKNIRIEKK